MINNQRCQALIDTGSMIPSVSNSLYKSLTPTPGLSSLTDFALDISGSNDVKVPYIGYCLLDISVPSLQDTTITVPVLITPDTVYSSTVPVLVGTIRHFCISDYQNNVPDCWQQAFLAISCVLSASVKAFTYKPITVKPFKTCTVTGKVRGCGEMTVGVTESFSSSQYLHVCPRVVHVRPGNLLEDSSEHL